jgi:hypothetical protein
MYDFRGIDMKRMPIFFATLALVLISSIGGSAQSHRLLRQPPETKLPGYLPYD